MPCPEQNIKQGETVATVVAFEVFVVEVVAISADRYTLALNRDPLEAGMSLRRGKGRVLQVEQGVDGVRYNHPMEKHAGEVQQMLQGVHRYA